MGQAGLLTRLDDTHLQVTCRIISKRLGFLRRNRKIEPMVLLKAFFLAAAQPTCSLRMLAMTVGLLCHSSVSKQALWKRINANCLLFFQELLGYLLMATSTLKDYQSQGVFAPFTRVLIHDSTHLALPRRLAEYYPGPSNQSHKRQAMITIQAVYEALSERFLDFRLTPFTCNDQKSAHDAVSIVRAGDLVLRDLGYFATEVFRDLAAKGAYFLSRYRHRTMLFDLQGRTINLLDEVFRTPVLDKKLCLGARTKLPVRLVAVPVPEQVANERRRKLRQHRDKRRNPTKEQLALLGWEILVTNVDTWSTQTVASIYGIRWRIEIIFKAWKSHFHLAHFPVASKLYVEVLICARLIYVTLFHICFSQWNGIIRRADPTIQLSLLKTAQFCSVFWLLITVPGLSQARTVFQQIVRHCTYESRKDRMNFEQVMTSLLS